MTSLRQSRTQRELPSFLRIKKDRTRLSMKLTSQQDSLRHRQIFLSFLGGLCLWVFHRDREIWLRDLLGGKSHNMRPKISLEDNQSPWKKKGFHACVHRLARVRADVAYPPEVHVDCVSSPSGWWREACTVWQEVHVVLRGPEQPGEAAGSVGLFRADTVCTLSIDGSLPRC